MYALPNRNSGGGITTTICSSCNSSSSKWTTISSSGKSSSDDGGNCHLRSDLYRMHPHIFLRHSDLYLRFNNWQNDNALEISLYKFMEWNYRETLPVRLSVSKLSDMRRTDLKLIQNCAQKNIRIAKHWLAA